MKHILLTIIVMMGLSFIVGCGGKSNASTANDDSAQIAYEMPLEGPSEMDTEPRNKLNDNEEPIALKTPQTIQDDFSGEETLLLSEETSALGFDGINDSSSSQDFGNGRTVSTSDYQNAINELLSGPEAPELYSLEGNCLDHSAALLEKLKSKGFDRLTLAQTSDNGEAVNMTLSDGRTERAYKTHYFLVDRSNGINSEIFIDPTIYQFIAEKPSQAAEKPIFVGKRFDLQNFYSQNRAQARYDISDPDSDRIGKYNPDELVCLIYSVDNCSINRTNF